MIKMFGKLPANQLATAQRDQSNPYRVLIVEDDHEQAELVMEFLRLSGPFQTVWTENLRGLWEYIEAGEPDILLIDYRLPDGTGLEAISELRRAGYDLPVILVMELRDERLAAQAMQLGAVETLNKSSDYLPSLPALIQKAMQIYELQRSLQRSLEQAHFQALLLENVREAVVVWNTEGKITYWSPAAEALYEVKATERLGKNVENCYSTAFIPAITTPAEGTPGQEIERSCSRPNGSALWVSSRVSALRESGAGERLMGYLDISRDITSQKNARIQLVQSNAALRASTEALRAERNFVSTVLDTVGALVVVLDRQCQIVHFNRASEKISGYSREEVKGRVIWEQLIPPEEVAAVKEIYARLLSGQFPSENESTWVTREGAHRLITWSNTVLAGARGRINLILATGIDITACKKAGAHLLNRNGG